MALLPFPTQSDLRTHFPMADPAFPFLSRRTSLSLKLVHGKDPRNYRLSAVSSSISKRSEPSAETIRPHTAMLQLAVSAVFFVGLGARACTSGPVPLPSTKVTACQMVQKSVDESENAGVAPVETESGNQHMGNSDDAELVEDMELKAAFERWKSKTYALTVPLRIVALRGSFPPSWIKEFVQAQGKRLKLQSELRGNLEHIFSDMALTLKKGHVKPKSAMAADIVTIGDSWLSLSISKGIIEPIPDAEGQDWFNSLPDKWKAYLRRNNEGELDCNGKIWGAPYRWGSMVIAYKKNKFCRHNLAPIEDWRDLWRPELAGKISMVDAPREVIGAVLKYMGASYNTKDIESQVKGGRNAAMQNLSLLQRQVRLFDSVHYLKAFGAGDVWVAVGWSSDILPAAKRMSNVAVIVPKSGTSLWADLWAIPAATKLNTNEIGGRARSPSPFIHQWIEFCLHGARTVPFQQEVIPGASPLAIEDIKVEEKLSQSSKRKPKLDTNLITGMPPPEILAKCEFLESLPEAALMDYKWLIANMRKQDQGWIKSKLNNISPIFGIFPYKPRTQQPEDKSGNHRVPRN